MNMRRAKLLIKINLNMTKSKTIFPVIWVFFVFYSCEKEPLILNDITQKNNLYVKNGILHFKSLYVLDSIKDVLSSKDKYYSNEWEENLNYISAKTLFDQSLEELESIDDLSYEAELEKVKNDVHINEDGSIDYKYGHATNAKFMNKDGLMFVDPVLYIYDREKTIFITDGDLTKVDKAKTMKESNLEENIIIVCSEQNDLKADPVILNEGILYNGKYKLVAKIKAESYCEIMVGAYLTRTDIVITAHAYVKNMFNKWRNHRTNIVFQNAYSNGKKWFDYIEGEYEYWNLSVVYWQQEWVCPVNEVGFPQIPYPFSLSCDVTSRSIGDKYIKLKYSTN